MPGGSRRPWVEITSDRVWSPGAAGKATLSGDLVEAGGGDAGGRGTGPGGEVRRGRDEQPDLDRMGKAGQAGRSDLGPAGAVGGVVAGDDVPGPGEPQPPRGGRS